jgi:hypothetical protein
MTKPTIQIGDEIREMTDQEHADWLALNEEIAAVKAAKDAKEAARAAVLAKLGLTADEAAVLLG